MQRHSLDDFGRAQGVLGVVERFDHHGVGGEGFQQGDGVVVYLRARGSGGRYPVFSSHPWGDGYPYSHLTPGWPLSRILISPRVTVIPYSHLTPRVTIIPYTRLTPG